MGPLLAKAKRNGILLYSALGHEAAHTFDRRWLADRSGDASLLDTGDASAICDFASVYATVRGMAIVPVSRWNPGLGRPVRRAAAGTWRSWPSPSTRYSTTWLRFWRSSDAGTGHGCICQNLQASST
ncbi:hypothetical protein H1235_09195 [Pseudoxanthomonas sp. NC8]|nr:hypothetical protein H1235_09195 [Pseudoxanthomonas sp. NC8]